MFYVIETQQNADGTASILTFQQQTQNEALSKWHEVLHYAAISTVYIHSCCVLNEELKVIARESYRHYPVEEESI